MKMKKLVILMVLLILSIILAVMTSCRTTRYVPMQDSVIIHRDSTAALTDSIRHIASTYDSTAASERYARRTATTVRDSVTRSDSTYQRDSIATIADTTGRVIATHTWHWKIRRIYIERWHHASIADSLAYLNTVNTLRERTDSLTRYRSLYTSLLRTKTHIQPKPYPVIKEVNRQNWIQKLLMWIGIIATFAGVTIVALRLKGR